MTTSPHTSSSTTRPPDTTGSERRPLRLSLQAGAGADGAWWPRSRDLVTEAADLVDHFPPEVGRINRLLFSRPDWDDGLVDGQGRRRIQAARGPVKVGSFPRDDTHLMILSLASGRRLRLVVVPSETGSAEAERLMGGPS